MVIKYKSQREIKKIKKACDIVAEVLWTMKEEVKPGVTTEELDKMAAEIIQSNNAKSAFKGYQMDNNTPPFPGNTCISLNDVVVHGIPDGTEVKAGDIVSVDVGVEKDNYYGDAAATFIAGEGSKETRKLLRVTKNCLDFAVDNAQEGKNLKDISGAIERTAKEAGFGIVKDMVGHGLGKGLHEDPPVPNYITPSLDLALNKGLVIAIEPMIAIQSGEIEVDKQDNWTTRTKDGSLAAHFEYSIAIDGEGAKILTEISNIY